MKLSYCVVNTNGRERLLDCLTAIARTHPDGVEAEVLVLDNASEDRSADAVRGWIEGEAPGPATRLIELPLRTGKAENDSTLLAQAQGEFALLLNEDAELRPAATRALLEALEANPRAAVAGAQLLSPSGERVPCAWRLPSLATALAGALFLHRLLVTQGGERTSEVGWVQSAAMLVRVAAAAEVGFLDPAFFVYSDETDFQKRLRDAGWSILHVPEAEAVHHEQLASDRAGERRRIVEFHRGRDRYMRKHHRPAVALAARLLGAWSYLPRALVAPLLPGHSACRYLAHARAALFPSHGEGLREAAAAWNEANARRAPRSSAATTAA